jgi:hypothetical protein
MKKKKKKKAAKRAAKKSAKKKAVRKTKKKAVKKAKKLKKRLKAKQIRKVKKAKTAKSKKMAKPASTKEHKPLALAPKAIAPSPPQPVTYSQESTRPIPGGFETKRTSVTEAPGQVEVDQEEFSIQETSGMDEGPHEEQENLPEEEEGLLDDLGEDDDLPPHLR